MEFNSDKTDSHTVKYNRREYGINLFDNDNQVNHCNRNGSSAVCIRNMCKRYEVGPPVLRNFSMNVRKGSIYGLLGSSGCGKTTILSCIVGLRKWDSGDVLVFGKRPGSRDSGVPGRKLGYMPQELALYNQLSIREIIQFYGRLYSMSATEIKEQWEMLRKLLELPKTFQIVGELSGGQKRRASLALALIHSPELLVLDEPTVGLDPLLRRSIWKHLFKIVSSMGTTILITTHYIEEARFSDTIGVMRNGRLLVEDSPSNLLHLHNCPMLEQVVLKLCRSDEDIKRASPTLRGHQEIEAVPEFRKRSKWNKNFWANNNESDDISLGQSATMDHGIFRKLDSIDSDDVLTKNADKSATSSQGGLVDRLKTTEFYQACRRVYGWTAVILLTFIRHRAFLVFLLFVPSIQGSLTLWAFGSKPRDLTFGIVNHELANWTEECQLPRHYGNSCDVEALSCKYLDQLKKDDVIVLKSYDTEQEALDQVHAGESWGYLTFPVNYSQHSVDFAAAKHFALNESIEGSRVRVHLDYSQYVATFFMIKHLMNSYLEYIKQLVASCDFVGPELEIPLLLRTPVYGNNEEDYTAFVMPGIVVCSISGMVSALTALLFIGDRKQGTLSRAHAAGLGNVDVMAGHIITQSIITIGQLLIWHGVLHFVFYFVIQGSQLLYLFVCLLVGVYGAGIGLLIGVLCRDEVEALIVGVFLIPIFMLIGGTIFAMERMSTFWRYVGYTFPVCMPTLSLRAIVVRGLGLTHSLVWPGFLVLVGYMVIFPILSVMIYKRSRK